MSRFLSVSSLAQVGPMAEYLQRIAKTIIKPNQDQYRAITKLEKLNLDCWEYIPKAVSIRPQSSLIFSRNAKQEMGLIPLIETANDKRLKGIWIVGSVG